MKRPGMSLSSDTSLHWILAIFQGFSSIKLNGTVDAKTGKNLCMYLHTYMIFRTQTIYVCFPVECDIGKKFSCKILWSARFLCFTVCFSLFPSFLSPSSPLPSLPSSFLPHSHTHTHTHTHTHSLGGLISEAKLSIALEVKFVIILVHIF